MWSLSFLAFIAFENPTVLLVEQVEAFLCLSLKHISLDIGLLFLALNIFK